MKNALEADLLEPHDLSLIWFALLHRLREAPEQRMRMNDLRDASLYTKSGITRLIDRIEAAGFVTRVRSVASAVAAIRNRIPAKPNGGRSWTPILMNIHVDPQIKLRRHQTKNGKLAQPGSELFAQSFRGKPTAGDGLRRPVGAD